jgi:hypothetical protein
MPVLTRGERPRFRITLEERSGRHLLERQPRYAILVNGEPQGELYYNMRGYQGYLPTVHGSKLDIGERGITAFRRQVNVLNREAAEAIEMGAADARRIVLTRPTEDGSVLFALSRDILSETNEVHMIWRREFLQARRLFGSEDIGIGFFRQLDRDPATDPVVLFEEEDRALAAGLSDLRSRIMDRVEAETFERYIEHVFDTADHDVKLVVSRRVRDEVDAEPEYVSRSSLDLARARYGDAMRLSDLTLSETRPAITDEAGRSYLRGEFTWFDVDGSPCEEDEGPQP